MKRDVISVSLCFLFLLIVLPATSYAAPELRTALVIGNGQYADGRLKNPVNDATDMAATLQRLGFTVILKKDARQQEMEEAIRDFGNRLKRGGAGLFFYAGHGIQISGRNYLIPIGARIEREMDAKYKAIDAEMILDEMANAGNPLNIVILDACRDNPLGRSLRSAGRGLAIISEAPQGTFITYSTSPGKTAADGTGRNSPYTAALLQTIAEPGVPIEQVFKKVRQRLSRETGNKQIPWEVSSLQGDFYFNPSRTSAAPVIERRQEAPAAEPISPAGREGSNVAMGPRPSPQPESFTDPVTGMEFIRIKGGCFQMGDTFGDGAADEKPVHEVCVGDFYLGKYEVTQAQWQTVMGDNPSDFKKGGSYPVDTVSWNDAEEFIGKLNERTGKAYRLPTEAEWEYAARSGGKRQKWAGTSSEGYLADHAWYDKNAGGSTQPVGEIKPNGLGLYDMSGNVWEWCWDWFDEGYNARNQSSGLTGADSNLYRVVRGGSWFHNPADLRVSIRYGNYPSSSFSRFGARLVRAK